jgi:hypothetical protein
MTMANTVKKLTLLAAAIAVGATGLFWSGQITPSRMSSYVSQAEAIIGRPLTPVSYAGVARRSIY